MNTFNYSYAVTILQLVLRHKYNLSKRLQKCFLTSCQGKQINDLKLQTINSVRPESGLELLWQKTTQQASLPRKQKRFLCKDIFRSIHFKAIETASTQSRKKTLSNLL